MVARHFRHVRHLGLRPGQHALSARGSPVRPDRGAHDRLGDAGAWRRPRPRPIACARTTGGTYGTTLAGLMDDTWRRSRPLPARRARHRISTRCPPTRTSPPGSRALPGRRIVYTNGTAPYAEQVLAARGLGGVFDAVYGVEHAGFRPNPNAPRSRRSSPPTAPPPTTAAMFEDDIRNLAAPHAMGMRTVHVAPDPDPQPHIHHHTDDLTDFLSQIRGLNRPTVQVI